jgi:hypothetical protein
MTTPDDNGPRSSGWLGRVAHQAMQRASDDKRGLKLLDRITRAQKTIVILGALAIVWAFVVSGPLLPWPLSELQHILRPMVGGEVGRSLYPLSVGLLWVIILCGAVTLWFTMSWRLGRFPTLPLVGFLGASGAFLPLFSYAPAMTLVGWLVVGTLAIAYIHYYRKGRFGYTRGATAAVFSHLALMFFFVGFAISLVEVLSTSVPAPPSIDAAQGGDTTSSPTAQPSTQPDAPPTRSQGEATIVEPGLAVLITDTTAPSDLRALFDAQYGRLRDQGPDPQLWELHIRCASVPEIPGVDPTLASGWFVTSHDNGIYTVDDLRGWAETYQAEGDRDRARWATDYADTLEQAGLASNADFVFETTERKDCDPLPLPDGAVTPDTVIAAAQRAGLEVTNPRDGTSLCHALGCARRVVTDQFNIIVWPTADAAETWAQTADGPRADAVAAYAAMYPISPIGLFLFAAVPTIRDVALFAPTTTTHLVPGALEEQMAMAGDNPDDEQTRYKQGLKSAAAWLERAQRDPAQASEGQTR